VIIDEIVLHNFGVYKGRQAIVLTPPSDHQPITLFCGMNGGGKTTLLDALRLVLYGKLARCSNRGQLPYHDYLARCTHRGVPASDGAALELTFRHFEDGEQTAYRVCRTWCTVGATIREQVEVSRDGVVDEVLSEHWLEHVEEFIPERISHLLFFDGEKIEQFADIDRSADLLSTAVHALLGLDLVDQLAIDLQALERRKQTSRKTAAERAEIDAGWETVSKLDSERLILLRAKAKQQSDIDEVFEEVRILRERFRKEGGELYLQRGNLQSERDALADENTVVDDELRELAAGSAPLLLVIHLLNELTEQDATEQDILQARVLSHTLGDRDAKLIEELSQQPGVSKAVLKRITGHLEDDREERTNLADEPINLEIDSGTRSQLARLPHQLDQIRERATALCQSSEGLTERLASFDRKLAAVPEAEAVTPILEAIAACEVKETELEREMHRLDGELRSKNYEIEQRKSALLRKIESNVGSTLDGDDDARIIHHAGLARDTLRQFRTRLVERHVDRIESYIMDCLNRLLRKKSLVAGLSIDPITFRLELLSASGIELPPDRLSAGERQLLAVAILWGLATAAGRPLPTVIDTPLGRLDSSHRQHLVSRYFPAASHQVLLLSTDEEISPEYYAALEPAIGRTYTLHYDDASQTTTVVDGYFTEVALETAS
jgi:DNA sulfur modification protein DndD